MTSRSQKALATLARHRPAILVLAGASAALALWELYSIFYVPPQERTSLRRQGTIRHRRPRPHDADPSRAEGVRSPAHREDAVPFLLGGFDNRRIYEDETSDGRHLSIRLEPTALPAVTDLETGYGVSSEEAQDIRVRLERAILDQYLPELLRGEVCGLEQVFLSFSQLVRTLEDEYGFQDNNLWACVTRAVSGRPNDHESRLSNTPGAVNGPGVHARALGGNEPMIDDDSSFIGETADSFSLPDGDNNLLKLLYHLAEEQAGRDGYVHRGVTCNNCGIVPITGIRYRCANCSDFDLCEICELKQVHAPHHVFYKVRIPAPFLSNSRHTQPPWYPGKPDRMRDPPTKHLKTNLAEETGFETAQLEAMYNQFRCLAASEWAEDPDGIRLAIDRNTFDKCFTNYHGSQAIRPNLIYDRTFAFYDVDQDGLISFREFVHGLACLNNKTKEAKLSRIFKGYDMNDDGFIDRKDCLRIFRAHYAFAKELTKTMIFGFEDEALEPADVRELIAGSQPLSSAFQGEIAHGDGPRGDSGKQVNSYGDLEIIDDGGALRDDYQDQVGRSELIGDAAESAKRRADPTLSSEFDSGRIPGLSRGDPLDVLVEDSHTGAGTLPDLEQDETDTASDLLNFDLRRLSDELGHLGFDLRYTKITAEDLEACGLSGELSIANIPSGKREEVISATHKRLKLDRDNLLKQTRKEGIDERLRRREFYVDEEEGAIPPEELDNLTGTGHVPPADVASKGVDDRDDGVSTTSEPISRPISPRSRSSSKVRFEDDVRDVDDVRSTTSSRSIPVGERWGGYEIPEAEKDLGKEIIYQLVQQGLNEMLDPLFKVKEDLAMEVRFTRPERERFRKLLLVDAARTESSTQAPSQQDAKVHEYKHQAEPAESPSPGLEDVSKEPAPTSQQSNLSDTSTRDEPVIDPSVKSLGLDTLLQISGYATTSDNGSSEKAQSPPDVIDRPSSPGSRPDPTLPQNRSSGDDGHYARERDGTLLSTGLSEANFSAGSEGHMHDHVPHPSSGPEPTTYSASDPNIPSVERLAYLRRLNRMEVEIYKRGGPGRISYEEFRHVLIGDQQPFARSQQGEGDNVGSTSGSSEDRSDSAPVLNIEDSIRAMEFLGNWIELATF